MVLFGFISLYLFVFLHSVIDTKRKHHFLNSRHMAWVMLVSLPMLGYLGSNLVLVIFLTDEDRFEFVLHFVTSGG